MSIPLPSEPSEPSAGSLQFDQAEFNAETPDHPTCAGCKAPIADQYYEASGHLICPDCRGRFENAMSGGSKLRRGFKALVLGLLAALIGSVGYYAITHATGYNIGLVAIVLGLLIGGAVKMGSESRGGWFYQLMALFLTYTAIAAMHIPDIIAGLQELEAQEAAAALDAGHNEGAPPIVAEGGESNKAETPVADAPAIKANDAAVVQAQGIPEPPPTFADFLMGVAALSVLVYAIPVLVAIDAPISGLIYAFALWEAWKLNKRAHVVFNGPYSVASHDADDYGDDEDADDGV